MGIISLLTTKKFIIVFAINIIFLFLVGLSFASTINDSFNSLQTWNNCESDYIAYDSREFDNNCYYYYGKNISVNLSTGDSIRLNTEVYQFINGKTYDYKSLLNDKNIVKGQYSNLNGNEIAIPISLANKYNLNIGDNVYLFGRDSYEIKYIFKDLYDIKSPSIYSSGNVVFIGNDLPVYSSYLYSGFNSGSAVYNEVYSFSKAKEEFLITGFGFITLISILTIFIQIGISIIFRKAELKNLYKDCVSGSKRNYLRSLVGVNVMMHILPALIASIVLIALGYYASTIAVMCSIVIFVVIKIMSLKIKIH